MTGEIQVYWRRFAVSVTAFANRLRGEEFLRTEIAMVLLQVVFALLLLTVVWASFNYLERDLASAFVARIIDQIQNNQEPLTAAGAGQVLKSLEEVQNRSLIAIVTTIILTTGLFGYVLARFALIPTRNALTSQKRFIGNIAHELRTPLSIIKTNTEVALLGEQDPETKKVFESNVEELDRISNIINNLLSISTFTRPERIEFANVDLGVIIDTAVEKLTPLAEKKRHVVTVRKDEDLHVWGNPTALEQVAMNLIKNAYNYTPFEGHIAITVEPDHLGSIRLVVKDSGTGIARKDLFKIFEPFYRAEESRSRLMGSSGLGLTIVSELVKLHNGKISIQSALNRGTTVTVLLPAGKTEEKKDSDVGPEHTEQFGEIKVDFTG